MRLTSSFVLLAFALSAAACSGISTTADFNPNTDFAAYQTYNWVPDGSSEGTGVATDQLIDSRVRSAIESELATRGINKVDLPQADMAVGYQVTSQDKVSYNTVSTGWGGGYGRRGRGGWGGGMSTTYQNTYTDGSIIVAVFDNADRELVFEGSATSTIDPGASPEERTEAISAAVAKIMEKYPSGN
jgi:hypothetical protein